MRIPNCEQAYVDVETKLKGYCLNPSHDVGSAKARVFAAVGAQHGDHLVEEYGGRKAKQRAELELDLIKELEDASGDALDKCRALWTLITTGNEDAVVALVDKAATKTK